MLTGSANAGYHQEDWIEGNLLSNGNYLWVKIHTYTDPAPNPNDTGHLASWGLENSAGWNISYKEHEEICETDDANKPVEAGPGVTTNIVTSRPDFSASEKAVQTDGIDLIFTNSGMTKASTYKVSDPTIKYNCHGYAKSITDKWVPSNQAFYKSSYYPGSGVAE